MVSKHGERGRRISNICRQTIPDVGAVIGKGLAATVDRRYDGTMSWLVDADLSWRRVVTSVTRVNCDAR